MILHNTEGKEGAVVTVIKEDHGEERKIKEIRINQREANK